MQPVSPVRIASLARRLLEASTLCSIATVTRRGHAHVNTAYFAWSRAFDLYWISEPMSRHSRNIRANPAAAVAVYDSSQSWGGPDRGIQLFGSAAELHFKESLEAERAYAIRFQAYAARDTRAYRFYRFRPRRLKLFDERALGSGVFVTASVHPRGTVRWLRTDVYRPGNDTRYSLA